MNECTWGVFFNSPEQALVVLRIQKYTSPQRIAEHGDDPSGLFLELRILLLCSRCRQMGIGELLLQMCNPEHIDCVLLFSDLESPSEIVGSRCELFSVELASALSGYCVQVERIFSCQNRRRAIEPTTHQTEDEAIHSLAVPRPDSRSFRTAGGLVKQVPIPDGKRRSVALWR